MSDETDNTAETSALDATPIDLKDELEAEEELAPPDEKNEARQLNVGNIFAAIFIGIALILVILMLASGNKKKKKAETNELDKAGSKTVIEFNDRSNRYEDMPAESVTEKSDDDIDTILDTLPPELQPSPQPEPTQAPTGVAPVGSRQSSTSYTSDRPDTRNSKSRRKVEGIFGLDYSNPTGTAAATVASVMNGTYTGNAANRLSKEEFIAQQMAQVQGVQNQLYGTNGFGGAYDTAGNANLNAAYQSNREHFFSNGQGDANNGYYLSDNTLWDGTIISAALETAINTDNPGNVMARVTENVYSSKDAAYLLIPEGTLLLGSYNSNVSYGQKRIQVGWNIMIRPDGYRCVIGNFNGVDAQGASGYTGNVSNHPFETLKALGMIAIYSMIQTEVANDINSQRNEYLQNAMTDVYSEAAKIGNKIIDRALDIKPTITLKVGEEIKLVTNVPLTLPPVELNPVTQKYVRLK